MSITNVKVLVLLLAISQVALAAQFRYECPECHSLIAHETLHLRGDAEEFNGEICYGTHFSTIHHTPGKTRHAGRVMKLYEKNSNGGWDLAEILEDQYYMTNELRARIGERRDHDE